MKTAALRELIQQAHELETRNGHLARLIQTQMNSLHPSINLSGEDAAGVLTRFVHAYVEQVPEFLEAAANVARDAGIEDRIKPVLKVAEQFFLTPPSLLDGHDGLDALLDEAYLAHRLVEEVNDRYIAHFGQPLIPLDTTVANVVAHQLIGEPFANQLDEAVHQAAKSMLEESIFNSPTAQAYRARLSDPQTVSAWKQWPCLSRRFGVELHLN
ncbi:hypothetical protein PKB_0078 [Pseudomonas knackmussii B13]|uniref:Uncharacterized protein n=1 Tax=Pseudomonas knackmussii (strain DSM 6978 / CCUG 54928 / LMG 23759 / B13) TaxID=1301098 RepID=A0A024HAA9_PSEKB|nr:hypothetical protein [Pseudomonas knackmussii]CDF81457.1 hypothetical protein PKB_0078 [Pseudomonas knackmussii B13]